jgi:putative transposase
MKASLSQFSLLCMRFCVVFNLAQSYHTVMKRLQGYQFQLRTTHTSSAQLKRHAGCVRFVWNKALRLQKERLDAKQSCLNYYQLANHLVQWKHDCRFSFLRDAPSQSLQQTLKDLDRAMRDAFDKKSPKCFPHFKKKNQHDSFRFPQGYKLEEANQRLFLPKCGFLRYRNSRNVLGAIKNITVRLRHEKWFVSIQTEREVEPGLPQGSMVGIDMGIARFATLSDGTYIEAKNSFKLYQNKLAIHQQRMSHKVKFSNNWKKARAKVIRIHSQIGSIRKDFLHKTSTAISKNHAVVCVEDLQVSNMTKSAAGTIEQAGKNVRAKSGLNRSILDQGWSEFRRQLDYKLTWNGGYLVAVNPRNTSRTCPCCTHISADNRKTQAEFVCVQCGYKNNADVVGAINIERAGHAQFACEVNGAVMPSAAGTHRSDPAAFA